MKNNLTFTGKISEIREVKTGESARGEWAAIDFEVTEDDAEYPQSGLFSMFKNGENTKYAKDFANYNKIGSVVTVHFNLDKNVYNKKDGSGQGVFYKNSAWKVEKTEQAPQEGFKVINSGSLDKKDEESDLPF